MKSCISLTYISVQCMCVGIVIISAAAVVPYLKRWHFCCYYADIPKCGLALADKAVEIQMHSEILNTNNSNDY